MTKGFLGLRIFTGFFFKLRWWKIGGGSLVTLHYSYGLWPVGVVVRVSFRLLGLSDDETVPPCPPVPFLWDSLKALLLHTIGGAGNCFYVSPFWPLQCEFLVRRVQHSEHLFVCGWGRVNKRKFLGFSNPTVGEAFSNFSCKWTEKQGRRSVTKANVARKPFITGD